MEPIESRQLSTAKEVWCFSRREVDEAVAADPGAAPRIRLLDPSARPKFDENYNGGRLYLMREPDGPRRGYHGVGDVRLGRGGVAAPARKAVPRRLLKCFSRAQGA